MDKELFDRIQKRAYEIYEWREDFKKRYGAEVCGDQMSDWLEAEWEITHVCGKFGENNE